MVCIVLKFCLDMRVCRQRFLYAIALFRIMGCSRYINKVNVLECGLRDSSFTQCKTQKINNSDYAHLGAIVTLTLTV